MKYSQATTVWFLLNSILLIPDAVLSHDDKTPWVVASEKPWWNYSQDPPSSPIGTLSQSKDQIAELSCISANPSIFDILEETKEHCEGKDYKVTFYLQNEEDYIRLDSFYVDQCSFNNILLKYKDWSLTSDKIDLRSKLKIKDTRRTNYRDILTENELQQNLNPSLQSHPPYRKCSSYVIPTEYDRTKERQATDSIYIYDDDTYENQDAGADIFNQNAKNYIHMKPGRNFKQNNYEITENIDKPSTSKKVNAFLDKRIKSDIYGTGHIKENEMQRNKMSNEDYNFNTNKKEKFSSADQNLLSVDDVSDLKISEVIDLLFNDENLNKDTPITFVLNPGIPDTVNSHETNKYSVKNTPRNLDDPFWVSGIPNGWNTLGLDKDQLNQRNPFTETVDCECPDTETNKNKVDQSIVTSDIDNVKYRYHISPKNVDYQTKDLPTNGASVFYMSPGPVPSLSPYSKTGRVPEDQDNYYIADEIPYINKFEPNNRQKLPQKLYNCKINLNEKSEPNIDTKIRHIHPCTSNLGTIDCQRTNKDNYIELEYVQPSVQQSQPVQNTVYPHIYHKPDTDQIAAPRIKLQSKHPTLSNVCRNQLPQNLEPETINRDIFESGNLSPIPIYEPLDKTPSTSTSGLSKKPSIKLSQLNFMPSYGPFSPYTITLPQTDDDLHPSTVNEPITLLLPIQPPMITVTDSEVKTNFTPLYKTNSQTKVFKKVLDTLPKVYAAPNENLESSGPLSFSTSNPATKDTVLTSVKEAELFKISIPAKEATPYTDPFQTSPISKKQYLKNPFKSPTSYQSDLSALHSANPYYTTSRNFKNEMTNFEFGPQDLSISENIKPLELPLTTSSSTPTNFLPMSRPTTSDITNSPFLTPQTSTHSSSLVPPLSTYKPNWFADNKLTQFSQSPEPHENSQSSVCTTLPTRTFPENFQDSNLKTSAVSTPLISKPLTYASKLNVVANELMSSPQTITPLIKVNPYIATNTKTTVPQLASTFNQEYTDVFLADILPNPNLKPIVTTSSIADKVDSTKPSPFSVSSPSKYFTPSIEKNSKTSPSARDMSISTIPSTFYSRPLIRDHSLTPPALKATSAFNKICPVTSPKSSESAYISPLSKIPPTTTASPIYSQLLPAYSKLQLKLPFTGLSYEKNILQTLPKYPTESHITPISFAVPFDVPNSLYSFPCSGIDKNIFQNPFQFSNPLSTSRYAPNLKSIPYSEPLTTTVTPESYLIPCPANANTLTKKDLIYPKAAEPPISPCSAYNLPNVNSQDFSVPTDFTSPLLPYTGKSFESAKSKPTLPCRTSTVPKNLIPISASPVKPLKVSLPIFNPIATNYSPKIPYPNLTNTLTASYTTSSKEFLQKIKPCSLLKTYKPHSDQLNDNKHYQTMLPSTTAPNHWPAALYSPVKGVLGPAIPLNYKNTPNRSISPTTARTILPAPLTETATAPLLDKKEFPLKSIPFTDPLTTTKSLYVIPSINDNNYQTISSLKLPEPSTIGKSPKYKYACQPKPTNSFAIVPKAPGSSTPLLKEKSSSWPYISNSTYCSPIQTTKPYQAPTSSVINTPYIIHEYPSLSCNEDLNNEQNLRIKSQSKSPEYPITAADTVPIAKTAVTYNPQIVAKHITETKPNYYYNSLKNGISEAKTFVSSTPTSHIYDNPLTYKNYNPRINNNEASFFQQLGDFTLVPVTLDPLPNTTLLLKLDSNPSVPYTAMLPLSMNNGKAFSPLTSSSYIQSQRLTQEFPFIQLPKNINYPCKHQDLSNWTPNSNLYNPLKSDYRYLNSPRTLKPLKDVTPLSNHHNPYYASVESVRPSLENQTTFTTPVTSPYKLTTPTVITPVGVTPITNRYNTLSSPVPVNSEPILHSSDNKLKYYYTPSHAKLVTPQIVSPSRIVANVPLSLPEVITSANTDPQSCTPYLWKSSPQTPKSIAAVSNLPVTYALPKIINPTTETIKLPFSMYQSTPLSPLSPILTPQVYPIQSSRYKTPILPAILPTSELNSSSQPSLPISVPQKYKQPSNYQLPASIPIKSVYPSKSDTQFVVPLQYSHPVQSLPYSIPHILPTPKQPIHIPILCSVPQAIPFKCVQSVPTSTNSVPLTHTPIDSQQYLTDTTPIALQYKYQTPASSISSTPVHQLTNNILKPQVYQPYCGTVLPTSGSVTPCSPISLLKSFKPSFVNPIISPNIMTYQSPLFPPIALKVTSSYTSPSSIKNTSPSWYVPLKTKLPTPPYVYPISIKPANKTISELESPTLTANDLVPHFSPLRPLLTPFSNISITPNTKLLSPIYSYYKKPILSPTFINSPTNANILKRKPSPMLASTWLQPSKLPLELYSSPYIEPISTSINPKQFSTSKNHSPEDLHNAQYTTLLYSPKLQLPFIKPQFASSVNTKLLPDIPEKQYSSPITNTFSVPSKTSPLLIAPLLNAYSPIKKNSPFPKFAPLYSFSISSPLQSLSQSDSLYSNNGEYSSPSLTSPFIKNPLYYYNPTYATVDPKQTNFICTTGTNIPLGPSKFSQDTPKYIIKPSAKQVPTSILKLTPREYKEYTNTINKLSALTPNCTPIPIKPYRLNPYLNISPNSEQEFTPITNARLPSLTSSDHVTTQSVSLAPTYNVIGTSPKMPNVPFVNNLIPSSPITKSYSESSIPSKLPPPVKFITPLYAPASSARYSLPCPIKQSYMPIVPTRNTPSATTVSNYNPVNSPPSSLITSTSCNFGPSSSKSSLRINPFIPSEFIQSNLPTIAEPFLPKKVIPSIGKTSNNYLSPTTPYNFKSLKTYYNPEFTGSLNNVNICNPIYKLNWKYPLLNAVTHSSSYLIPEPVLSRGGEIPATPKTEPSFVDINDSKFKTFPLQSSYDSYNPTLQYLPYNNSMNYKISDVKNKVNTLQNEFKSKTYNYINNNEKIKSDLYESNAELSIPLGNILVAKKDSTNSVVYTINPSVDLRMWPSSFKIVEAKLELKLKDVNIRNFQPVLKTLNSYDIKEIENLVTDYIQNKYGNVIVVRGSNLLNNEYDAIKTCSNTCSNKCNLLWPVDTLNQQGKTVQYQRGF